MQLVYQYMAIFLNYIKSSSSHHSLQVENCDKNSRLVVNEDDNGKFRLERVKHVNSSVYYKFRILTSYISGSMYISHKRNILL